MNGLEGKPSGHAQECAHEWPEASRANQGSAGSAAQPTAVSRKKAAKARAKAPKKAPRKSAAKKAAKPTAIATITDIITKAKKGIDTATLEKKTGLKTKQIWNVINALKRQGKVKNAEKGVYVRV